MRYFAQERRLRFESYVSEPMATISRILLGSSQPVVFARIAMQDAMGKVFTSSRDWDSGVCR